MTSPGPDRAAAPPPDGDGPAVEVLVATAGRPEMLRETLSSVAAAAQAVGPCRVTVVDNADDPATRRVCDATVSQVPVRRIVETEGGKSTALNRGLERVEAPLVAFTDDDVIVDEGWLDALVSGAARWPEHRLFGGRVLPRWPPSTPEWLPPSRYAGVAFSVLDPELEEGPHAGFRPFGPNFAVRREVFDAGLRFYPDLGPASGEYVMGNETELCERITAADGRPAVFLPDCSVRHTVREEQLSLRWLLRRARRYGRSLVARQRREGRDPPRSPPRWLYTGIVEYTLKSVALAALGRRTRALDCALDAAVDVGRWEACR